MAPGPDEYQPREGSRGPLTGIYGGGRSARTSPRRRADPRCKRLHDAALVTEAKLRQVFDKLGRHGRVLVVVDQPATIGALPVAVA